MIFKLASRLILLLMLLQLNLKGIYCGCNITLDVGSCVTWSKTKRNYSVATQFCTGNHGNLITVNDICNHDIVHQLLSSVEAEQNWIDYDGDVSDGNWCPRYDSGRKQREEVSCSKEHHFFCYYNEGGCTNSTDNFKRVIIEPRRTFIPDITTSTHSRDEITIFPDNSSVAEKGNYTMIAIIGVYLVGVTVLIITGIAVVKIKERRKKHAANFTEEDPIHQNYAYAPVHTRLRMPLLQGCYQPRSCTPFGQDITLDDNRSPPASTLGIRSRGQFAIQAVERSEMSAFVNLCEGAYATPTTSGRSTPAIHVYRTPSSQSRKERKTIFHQGHKMPRTQGDTNPTTSELNTPAISEHNMPIMLGFNKLTQQDINAPSTTGLDSPVTLELNTLTTDSPNTPTMQGRNTQTTSGLTTSDTLELNTLTTDNPNTPTLQGRNTQTTPGLTTSDTLELDTPTTQTSSTLYSSWPRFCTPNTSRLKIKRLELDMPTTLDWNTPTTPLCTQSTPELDTPTTSDLYMPLLNPGEDASSLSFNTKSLRADKSLQELVENPTYASFRVTTEL